MQKFPDQQQKNKRINLLIGMSGSVATIKIQKLLQLLINTQKFNIKLITTQTAKKFLSYSFQQFKQSFISKNIQIYQDSDQYQKWQQRGDPVLHIELRKWADIYLVAPMTANTLAKFNSGLSDNLITLVFRCWNMNIDQQSKLLINPIVLCPAMNNLMYQHPITNEHLEKMVKWGCIIIDSIEKVLVCGEKGKGAMEEIQKIVSKLINIRQYILNRRENIKIINQQKGKQ